MPQNFNKWTFAGILQFPPTSHNVRSGHQFASPIVKIKTSSPAPNGKHWFRAGYLAQIYQGARINSKLIPLNETTIFELTPVAGRYTLSFCAVPWLRGKLRLELWEDASPISQDLPIGHDEDLIFQKLLDLEAKVDAL
jgi:hypothetical protein